MAELKAGSKDYSRFRHNLKTFTGLMSSHPTTSSSELQAALEALPPTTKATGLPQLHCGRQVPNDPRGNTQSGKDSYEGKQSCEGTASSSAVSSSSSGVGGGSDASGDGGGDRDPPRRPDRRDDKEPDQKEEEEEGEAEGEGEVDEEQ